MSLNSLKRGNEPRCDGYTYKKRGSSLVTRPTLGGSGIACLSKRATPKPTHLYINSTITKRQQGLSSFSAMNIHLMGVFVALKFDKRFGTARFPSVKHKASSTPFLYIDSLPQPHPKARHRQENNRKVRKNKRNLQTFPKLFSLVPTFICMTIPNAGSASPRRWLSHISFRLAVFRFIALPYSNLWCYRIALYFESCKKIFESFKNKFATFKLFFQSFKLY